MMHLLKKHLGKIYPAIGWTLLVILLLSLPGTMLPNESHFTIPQFDKFVHITLFGGFVLLWNFYLSRRPLSTKELLRWFFFIFMLGNALGIGMEFVQKYWIPFRDFDTEDIIADMIGAGLGYGISNLFFLKTV
ncbi:MAG TPA: VanZ family protein, partial [Puia sp.]|jgi:VanZ family protein|nr:VanZ family protein [Puia sp.]HVV05139.1 VanZ family protein [Puia sp.]